VCGVVRCGRERVREYKGRKEEREKRERECGREIIG